MPSVLPPLPPGEGRGEGATRGRRGLLLLLALPLVSLTADPAAKEGADLLIVNARVVTVDAAFSVYDPGAVAVKVF